MNERDDRSYPIREDMRFQRHSWMVQRIGWIAMGLAAIAAMLGVFADGPLSSATARKSDDAIRVDYERFLHKTARTWFTIRLSPMSAGEVLVRLSPAFARTYDVEVLVPPPLRSSAGAYGLEFVFAPSAARDLAIQIAARAKRFGLAAIDVEVEGRGVVNFTQLIYP